MWQATPYTLPYGLAALMAAILGLFVSRRCRLAPGSSEFALFAAAVTIWCGGNALELASAEPLGKTFWTRIEYLGVISVPPLWLVCMARYCGSDGWLTRRRLGFLALVPTITFVLIWTNQWHGLIWTSIGVVTTGPFTMWVATYGPWFWVHVAYSYLLLATTTLLVVRFLVRSPRLFSGQATSVLFGMSMPWIANILYLARLSPFPYLDVTPFGFAIGTVGVGLGLTRFRLFELVPIARAVLVEAMPDAVLVLDAHDRVVDLNPAARQLIGSSAAVALGKAVSEVLTWWCALEADVTNPPQQPKEVELEVGGGRRYFELRTSPLLDPHQVRIGQLVLLQETTERKRAELQHEQLIREQAALAEAERARRHQRLLVNSSLQLAKSLDYETTLLTAASLAVPALADWCLVMVAPLDETASQRIVSHVAQAHADTVRQLETHYPWDPCADRVRQVLACKRPELLAEIPDQLLVSAACDADHLRLLRTVGLRCAILAPLVASDRILGVVSYYSCDPERRYGEDELALGEELASRCALAIENARLYHVQRVMVERLRQLRDRLGAAEREQLLVDERHRIARELHDRVEQAFFSIGLTVTATLTRLQVPFAQTVQTSLSEIRASAIQGAEDLRAAIFALRSAEIHDHGVVQTLWQLVRQFQMRTGVEADLVMLGSERLLSSEIAEALYSVARESLANVEQHAHASVAVLSLWFEPHAVTLAVQDDGVGASPLLLETLPDSTIRFGLRALSERVSRLGGTFTAGQGDEGRFIVRAHFPVGDEVP